jgi:hypothetical protein
VIRARTEPRKAAAAAESTPLGDSLRLLAVAFKRDGNDERAAGIAQAADLVDAEARIS